MPKYSVVPFKTLDEAVLFNEKCLQLSFEFRCRRAVMKSIHDFDEGYPVTFKQFEVVFFLDEAAVTVLRGAGIRAPFLGVIDEAQIPESAGLDLGPTSVARPH